MTGGYQLIMTQVIMTQVIMTGGYDDGRLL